MYRAMGVHIWRSPFRSAGHAGTYLCAPETFTRVHPPQPNFGRLDGSS